MKPEANTIELDIEGTETQVAGEFPPIPAGLYPAKVTDAKLEETKDGWPMPTLTVQITDGEYKGRQFWHRRPIIPPGVEGKKTTISWAKGDAEVLKLTLPKRSTVLDLARFMVRESLGRVVGIKVGFGTGDYKDRNEIKALIAPDKMVGAHIIDGEILVVDENIPF